MRMRLGEYLVFHQYLTEEQIEIALRESRASGFMLGECIVRLGFMRWHELETILKIIAPERLIETKSGQSETVLPREFMLKTRTIDRGDTGDYHAFATRHEDIEWIRSELKRLTGKENIRLVSASQQDFERVLYNEVSSDKILNSLTNVEDPNQIISTIVNEAIALRASDIHVESMEKSIHIRYRVDGRLRNVHALNSNIHEKLFTRIKDRAGMDVSQRREPQPGSFTHDYRGRSIDFRVQTVLTGSGEKIVIRILDKERVMVDIGTIGITAIDDWRYLAKQRDGLIMVCGATGSGKTTTLYSTIMDLDRIHKAIYTIEDPIEYKLPGISQVQISTTSKTRFDYADALKTFLRLDPDIIVVGEIRDPDTAESALNAARTGHLVYATMHTNDIPSTVDHLCRDLKVSFDQLSHCLRGIIVQRLVRKLCTVCSGRGCKVCQDGYHDRTLISEFIKIDNPDDLRLLSERKKKYLTFADDAFLKVKSGITDCKEVSTVLNDDVWFCKGGQCVMTHKETIGHECNWVEHKDEGRSAAERVEA